MPLKDVLYLLQPVAGTPLTYWSLGCAQPPRLSQAEKLGCKRVSVRKERNAPDRSRGRVK